MRRKEREGERERERERTREIGELVILGMLCKTLNLKFSLIVNFVFDQLSI